MSYVRLKERKAQFIAATVKVIHESGLGGTTTRRIADEAGASLASLHYTFANKEDLFVATMIDLGSDGRQEIEANVPPGMGIDATASAIINTYIEWMQSSRDDQLIEYELHMWAHRRPELAHLPAELYRVWIDFIKEILVRGNDDLDPRMDIESLARAIVALIDGFNLQAQLFSDDFVGSSTKIIIEALRRSIKNGDFCTA